ncbi:MAG: hypothetical protein K0R00_2858 [Herbinix sp.]|jgi:hypothetical protein|nr:hypothetical protein [Herbinix sp.]
MFENKPFYEVIKNIMKDSDLFPYDLYDIDTIKEIKYVLGFEVNNENEEIF